MKGEMYPWNTGTVTVWNYSVWGYNGSYLSMHLIKPKEHAIQRMNSALDLITRYQCWLINYNKCTTLMQNSNNIRNCVSEEGWGVSMNSILSARFFCNRKTALKICLLIFFNKCHRIAHSDILKMRAKWSQSCPSLWDPMDCSPAASSVQGLLQARILDWVAMPSYRGSAWPRDRTLCLLHLLHWQSGSSPLVPPGKPFWRWTIIKYEK